MGPAAQCWMPVLIVAGEEPAFAERFGSAAAGEEEVVQDYMTGTRRISPAWCAPWAPAGNHIQVQTCAH